MRIKIIQFRNLAVGNNNLLYVDVEFIDIGQVVHRNDFLMQTYPTRRIYIGPPLADGETPDPADYQEVAADVRTEILENISRYLGRHPNLGADVSEGRLPADYRSQRIRQLTEDTDPLGLRAIQDVAGLVGLEMDPIV